MPSILIRRILDLCIATVLLVVAAPLMLGIALAIYVTMGRPVFFCQKRPGRKGKPFVLFKFRTMREAFGPDGGPLPDHRRLTPLGRLLRKTSLDELPQLFNVCRSDMSLVGPRPLLMEYLARYTPEQARRHDVKPGLTGWVQVNGRNALSWERKFELDVWYVDNRGLWLDARILLRTVWKVLRRQGVNHAGDATMPKFMGTAHSSNPSGDRRYRIDQAHPVLSSMHARSPVHGRLAIEGGTPVRKAPFPAWPEFDDRQIDAVTSVLRSGKVNYWTGQQGGRFEEEFGRYVGCRHAVAVANGTVALELALAALGIGPGDEVIVPARSFVATASCCVMRGAVPVFADVDPESQNLTADTIRAALTPRTRAIIAVHLAGWPCDMDSIVQFSQRHGFRVIEDCAQAHGATYKGQPVGSFGDVAAFSFCQDKILTTGGEGGMITTNDEAVWKKAWSFKDHGKSWDAIRRRDETSVFRWLHESIGTNWRITEMQAAIGRIALERLPEWVETRRRHAALLDQRLGALPALRVPSPSDDVAPSYYRYYFFLRPELLRPGWSRDRIVRALVAEGIPCGSGVCPEIYREKAFDATGLRPAKPLPIAGLLGQTSLMLHVHPTLSTDDVLATSVAVKKVLLAATLDRPSTQRRAA